MTPKKLLEEQEKLRKEWINYCLEKEVNMSECADWWTEKLRSSQNELIERLVEECERMKLLFPENGEEMADTGQTYNHALQGVINLLNKI